VNNQRKRTVQSTYSKPNRNNSHGTDFDMPLWNY
jgi:hypothetical protein